MPDLSLFSPLAQADLTVWARSLTYFRICTSQGGHGGDNGTWIEARPRFEGKQDLIHILTSLQLPLEKMPSLKPPVELESTPFYKMIPFEGGRPTAISSLPEYQQIGHCKVGSDAWFAWVLDSSLQFRFGTDWTIDANNVAQAQSFERHLHQFADRVSDPPVDKPYCLCPKYYPSIWA